MTSPLPEDANFDELFGAWDSAHSDFAALAHEVDDTDWSTPSGLPGWTVGDIVGHVAWIESVLLGRYDPPHEPDWDALPHVTTDFGRVTEIPVDLRRGRTRQEVLAELDAALVDRRAELLSGQRDAAEQATGLLGQTTLGVQLRMRTFDAWVHEQDIRDALARPGHLDSAGARATASQLIPGLGKAFGKGAQAQLGQALVVEVTGPVQFTRTVRMGDDGRARVLDGAADEADVHLTMDWSTYLGLACGRNGAWSHDVRIEGDRELGERMLRAFCVTP